MCVCVRVRVCVCVCVCVCVRKITRYTAINVWTAGHKIEYTPKWKCPNWAHSVNILCGHHYFPALP